MESYGVKYPVLKKKVKRERGGREEGRTDERTGQVNPHCEQFLGGEGAAAAERRSIYTAVEWLAWMLHWTQAMGGTISLTIRIVVGQLPSMFSLIADFKFKFDHSISIP